MSFPRMAGRRPASLAIATAAVTTIALLPAGAAQAAHSNATAVYLVQLAGSPLATYTGGVNSIPATKPEPGTKLNPKSWNYRAYRDHLRTLRADTLRSAKVDSKKIVADLDTVINGVAARLTEDEVAKLRATPGVVQVWKNTTYDIDTISTPKFLGLDGADGAWAKQFGDVSHAGEGVIVGDIDTGIWPESPSFAALPEPRPDADTIAGKWFGECVPGEVEAGEDPVTCNNKLIGARWYNFGSLPIVPEEFTSPRDFDGHGTHTASTAAGDNNAPAVINGVEIGKASGIAPAARLAAYKICFEKTDFSTASCGGLETVAAIDDAVADGVDVINFSISGATGTVADITELAFLNAAAAGVFVATSAGNSGPTASTVAHNDPWVTTVAASSHDRGAVKKLTLGNGATFTGVGLGPAVPSAPLIDSKVAGLPGADPTQVELCFIDTLDPAKVTGKIVLCRRGTNARVDKSMAVRNAGGLGMILYNPTTNSLNADFHFVPSVHVDQVAGAAIKAYLAGTASPTASLQATDTSPVRAPVMADFSSAGPALAGSGDLLKPDITAPGVDVIAAVAPVNNAGNGYNALSGTSMSSPHVAGLGALLKSKNPGWSPMAIKSAIMTTATTLDNTGQPIQRAGAPATPLDFGAGHIRPGSAFDPGLVYESGPLDWLQYACGIGETLKFGDGSNVCDTTGSIDPSDLNYASLAIGDLAGKQVIKRTVSNATNQASVYLAKIEAPPGFTVKVTPSVLTVLPRKTASYTVEISRSGAPVGQYKFGSLTWADLRGHTVRSPIAVRAVELGAPAEIGLNGTSGSTTRTVHTGFAGTLNAKPFGLVPSAITTKHLVGTNTTFSTANPMASDSVGKVTVTVPAGTKLARFATFAADYPVGTDLDLFVYSGGGLVGSSAGGDAQESVTVTAPGTYDIYVVQFSLAAGRTEQDVLTHSFVVGGSAAGNLTATPASQKATFGGTAQITVGWSGLTAGRHYLGVVEYSNGSAVVGQSAVAVAA